MSTVRKAVLLLIAAQVIACGGEVEVDAPEFAVHVVDPGNQPGRRIVYDYPDGAWPRFFIGVELAATWSAGDRQDQPAALPRGRFPVSIETKPAGDGSAVATVRIGKPVPAIPGCGEFGGEMILESSGRIRSSTLAVPADAPPRVRRV